jgi:hypothetical protein
MKRKKHEGGVKARVAHQEALVGIQLARLKNGTLQAQMKKSNAEGLTSVNNIARNLEYTYEGFILRDISTFNRNLKTKDPGKVRLLVATHLFGKYKVPSYLQECWYQDEVRGNQVEPGRRYHYNPNPGYLGQPLVSKSEIDIRRRWFITAASGRSLFKEDAAGILTKKEVHAFLNCPIPCNFREAIIYALASQWISDIGVITRIMKSKLNTNTGVNWVSQKVWREIVHFYCVTPGLTLMQMNDLFDYFSHMARNPGYSLKGRTLTSLQRQMQDWHWELARVKKMGNAEWTGIPLEDEKFELNGMTWWFTQLKTSKALASEGNSMHHCVYSYQQRCIDGLISVWSVKKKGCVDFERALTLEITGTGDIIQARGFANRAPKKEEHEAVSFWSRKNRFGWSKRAW